MSNIQIFNNSEFGEIRTATKDGEPLFVTADVCKALEIGNPAQATARLDADEKGIISNDTLYDIFILSMIILLVPDV